MKRIKSLLVLIFLVSNFLQKNLFSQNCVPTGLNNSVITTPCTPICNDLTVQVPDLRSTTSYTVISIPYKPYAFTTAGATTDPTLYADDAYSNIFNLPFPFCFYGNVYTQAVVSSNGLVTFDVKKKNECPDPTQAAWLISSPLPHGGIAGCGSDNYPKLSIMGMFMDLDPRPESSPANRKIEWRVEGTSPCRRFVVSYYNVGLYEDYPCWPTDSSLATFQIVMTESTGVIDVHIDRKQICTNTSGQGRGILGIQGDIPNDNTQYLVVPGKDGNDPAWSANRESYRFVPTGGNSRFVSSELLAMDLTPIAVATTANTSPGLIDLTFQNICSQLLSTQYIIRTTFAACDNPGTLLVSNDTITVNKSTITANVTKTPTSCNGANNGAVTIDPAGAAPFRFSIDGTPEVTGPAPHTFTNVSAGPHKVIATDMNGCTTDSIDVVVVPGPTLTTTAVATDALCNGAATGSITVAEPTIGDAPYEYSLDGTTWQPGNVFNGLAAGSYTVFFREKFGCQGNLSITVGEPPALTASSNFTPVICNGESNGVITLSAAGGTAPYEYSIDGGANWQAANSFAVPAGSYTLSARDAHQCITTGSITVTEPAALSASFTNTAATCDGGKDGSITVNAAGGNGGYEYSIDGGANWQSSNLFNEAVGDYNILVRDSKGCVDTFLTQVALNNNLVATPQNDAVICEGSATQLNFNSNAQQFIWTPAIGLSDVSIANPVANPVVTTQYIVTATLGICAVEDTVLIKVNPAPVPDAGPDGTICYGQLYPLQAGGGSQYQWLPDTYLDNNLSANPIADAKKSIIYTLSVLSDANGCPSLVSDTMLLSVTPLINVKTFPSDTIGYSEDQIQLSAVLKDSTITSYRWRPSRGLNNIRVANPVVTLGAVGEVTNYTVETVTDNGCLGEGYVTVKVYKGQDIYVATAFTPNGDGLNDRFIPIPVGIKSLNYFRVFNRWGQLLFQTKQLHDGWDGKFNGAEQASGVYVWMIEAVTDKDKVITKKGTVTLIR